MSLLLAREECGRAGQAKRQQGGIQIIKGVWSRVEKDLKGGNQQRTETREAGQPHEDIFRRKMNLRQSHGDRRAISRCAASIGGTTWCRTTLCNDPVKEQGKSNKIPILHQNPCRDTQQGTARSIKTSTITLK